MPTDKDSLKGFVDFNNTSQHAADSVMNRYFVGFPYSLPSQNNEYVSGIEDITDWVGNGYSPLYSRDSMPGYSFYTDGSGKVYRVSDAENINTSGMSPLSYSDMRKMLPKREYIGGKDYRFKTAQRIPGFLDKISERAKAYGIDPNLVLNRILHEGWIDQQVINYNGLDASQQGGYWNGLWDAPVSGYGSFGLDYAGNNLMNGVYELKDPDASWRSAEFTDYEGGKGFRVGTSLEADNLSSAIEILAAELAYRQREVAKRYGKKGSDLNVWTNAAFNMGLNNNDFKNEDWVRNQYTYPDYYGQIETQKKLGGIVQRFGADRLRQYFASGGSINRFYEGGSTGEIRPSKPSNVVQRYLSDHPMTGHRLRKAGVLAADLARVFPGTSFLMDLYDSKHPQTESDKITNPLGAIGRGFDIITNTVREVGEEQPSIRRIIRGSLLGRLISLPDLVSDSAQFIRDFSEPVENFATGGLLRGFDEGGDIEEEYYDTLNTSSISSKLPSINTEKGKRYAKNMAKRVVAGDMKMSDVPNAYKAYVEGEVNGAMPVRNAINTTGVKTALGTLAVPAGVIVGAELGAGIATNPILKTAFDVAGSADGIRNAVSDNGVKKTARLVSEGNYGSAALSGLGDAFDIIGGVGLARDVYSYGRGVAKRGAEAVLRMGDAATNIPDLKTQFGDKRTLNYVFNPFASRELAYKLPFRYSGESAIQDEFTGAHFGDIVDQYLGKVGVPDATYDTSILPEYLQKYIAKNYPDKKIPIRDLGNAGDTWQEVVETAPGAYLSGDSPGILKDGISVLDPGGFVSQVVDRVPAGGGYDNVTLKNWDIWKFNDKDYVSRHSNAVGAKDVARRLGLKFLDSQGTPIVHTWTSHGGYAVSPEVVSAVNKDLARGGLIERYGANMVRAALSKMRGAHKFDGESESTSRMQNSSSQLRVQNQYLKLPESKPSIATNFVEESAPLVQLDDDAIYLGDIEPAVFVSYRMRPAAGERPKINMEDAAQLSETIDSSNPNIMLRAVPSDLNSVTRNSLDREVLVRAGIKGESIKDTSLNMLASLDDDVRKNVEAELVSQGWYDTDADQILSRIKNRSDEAYRLQEHLRDLGYDLGKYGKNKDGVDGMIGRMTKTAIDKYVKEHKADALRDIASFGAFSDSQTADALAKRVQYMQAHDKPSDKKSIKIEDSLLGEQNIGTQYDSQFDDYQVGGFDASNIYNVPVEEYGRASSPLSFKSFPKTCSTNECASAVTNFFLSNFGGDFIDKYNLRGHAWTMGNNITRAGGKRIFNLFDDAGAPRENNKEVTINYVQQRAKDPEYKKMLSENIGVGDIVELLNPGSKVFKRAYKESNGHNQNTHIGMVVEKGGELYVLDNSGGTYHHAKLSDVINGKEGRGVLITGAVSVNDGKDWRFRHNDEGALYRADMSELGITPNEDYNKKVKGENGVGIKYHNYNNEAAYREMASLKRNSGELMSSYGLNAEEFNKLAALTHAASMMETRNGSIAEGRKFRAESGNISFGEGVGPLLQQFGRYTLPNMSESISSFIRGAEQNAQRRNGEDTTTASVLDKIPVVRKAFKPVSRGLTNVKADYHFTRDEQASLPVQGNYAEQPESSAIMGFSVLAKNYNYIKERLAGTKLVENKELLYTLTALAHNQGLNNIDTNIARYLSSGDEEELLQYMHREKEYRDALKKKDKERAEYYNGPRYSRLMMDFTNYNKYNLVI